MLFYGMKKLIWDLLYTQLGHKINIENPEINVVRKILQNSIKIGVSRIPRKIWKKINKSGGELNIKVVSQDFEEEAHRS